jgi:hypothetical protein
MPETRTYSGSCHCGKVRYEVNMELTSVMSCNCSMCSRAGWLLSFVPAEQFKLLSGESDLADYQFGRKHIHHQFCTGCGIKAFVRGTSKDGKELRGINVRCLEGVDLDALPVTKVDGKSF